jgi:UPF0716 family protein affecting phage T7 exclusion
MFLIFFLFLIGATVLEFKAISLVYGLVAGEIGGLGAVAAIILSFLLAIKLGSRLIQSRCSLLLQKVQMGQVLEDDSSQSLLFLLAGLLLMIPGYVSDVVALLCLFPPTGWLLRFAFRKWMEKLGVRASKVFYGMSGTRTKYWYSQIPPQMRGTRSADPSVIDVEAHDLGIGGNDKAGLVRKELTAKE